MRDAGGDRRARGRANPKIQAVIAADKGVDYGRVVEIIDTVKANGVTTFALDIERGPAAGRRARPRPATAPTRLHASTRQGTDRRQALSSLAARPRRRGGRCVERKRPSAAKRGGGMAARTHSSR